MGSKTKAVSVGSIYRTNNDGDILVLDIVNAFKVRVLFLEYPCEKWVRASNILIGGIRNPIRPNVCGVGYLGIGSHRAKINYQPNPVHQVWHDMLKRVYRPRTPTEKRAYDGTSVHPHWHNFQNFADWYQSKTCLISEVRWHLDKDLLIPGNRVYGPETCCVIPDHVNELFTDHAVARGSLPLGVARHGNRFQANISESGQNRRIGTYPTIREAQLAYWSAKFHVIRQAALTYWNYIPELLALRLINFGWSDAFAYYGDDARLWES